MARFGNDDGYAIGPANVLFPAIAHFATEVKEKHLLELQVQKTEVFSWDGMLPPQAPPNMKVAGVTKEGSFFPRNGGLWNTSGHIYIHAAHAGRGGE